MPRDRLGNERPWGIGEMADGSINVMTVEEARRWIAERAVFERAFDALLDSKEDNLSGDEPAALVKVLGLAEANDAEA
jgi:hypothetical protein